MIGQSHSGHGQGPRPWSNSNQKQSACLRGRQRRRAAAAGSGGGQRRRAAAAGSGGGQRRRAAVASAGGGGGRARGIGGGATRGWRAAVFKKPLAFFSEEKFELSSRLSHRVTGRTSLDCGKRNTERVKNKGIKYSFGWKRIFFTTTRGMEKHCELNRTAMVRLKNIFSRQQKKTTLTSC